MKKYFVKPGVSTMVSFDPETQEIDSVDYMNSHVDWMYTIPEDGEIVIDGATKSVKKGDIVIKFYRTSDYKQNNPVIVRNKEWKANIAAEKAYVKKMREDAELKKVSDCCECADCDTCCAA